MVVAAGVAGAKMMSQEMMRTTPRMRRRTIDRGCGVISRATCRPGIPSTVSLNCLTEIYGSGVVAREDMADDMNMAFDPTKSPCYKVVHVGNVDGDVCEVDYFLRIQTYSSEPCVWSVSDDRFDYIWFDGFGHGIYWKMPFMLGIFS
nr:hypothetical protein [Tanacetum cinerariifolium]